MKRIFVFCIMLFSCFGQELSAQSNISSQEYKTALGVKFYPGAVTLKHFLNEKAAIEGLAYFWNRGGRITGLYEFHWDIPNAPGLKWYAGPGAHVGFYNAKYGGGSSLALMVLLAWIINLTAHRSTFRLTGNLLLNSGMHMAMVLPGTGAGLLSAMYFKGLVERVVNLRKTFTLK